MATEVNDEIVYLKRNDTADDDDDDDDVDLEASSLLVPSDDGAQSSPTTTTNNSVCHHRGRRTHEEVESENERLRQMVQELQEEVAYWKHQAVVPHKPRTELLKAKQSFCTLDTAVGSEMMEDDDRSSLTSSSTMDTTTGALWGFLRSCCSCRGHACTKRGTKREEEEEDHDAEEEDVVQQRARGNIDDMSWQQQLYDRGGWLVGLLVLQSMSSFIIKRNEELLQHHDVLIQFLTMLVGAGGNAGNQASVRVIRGLATGKIVSSNMRPFLRRELQTGVVLSLLLGLSGYIRATVFQVPLLETMAITSSLWMIVMISIIIGTILPLTMKVLGIDPAHSSTSIQVIMDILGVALTVHVSSWILDSSVFSSSEL